MLYWEGTIRVEKSGACGEFFGAGFGGLSTVGIGTCSVGARKITHRYSLLSCILYKAIVVGEFA